MDTSAKTPSAAEITAYNTKADQFHEEIAKLSWLTVCQLESGNVEKAKKTAAACIKVHEEAQAHTLRVFGPNG